MSIKDNGGPAFPASQSVNFIDCRFEDDHHKTDSVVAFSASGMSLRDYFAGMALQGILAHIGCSPGQHFPDDPLRPACQTISEAAFLYADAMLKARQS